MYKSLVFPSLFQMTQKTVCSDVQVSLKIRGYTKCFSHILVLL